MSVLDRPNTKARLFLGLGIPETIGLRLKALAEQHFDKYVGNIVPIDRMHVTLFFFGEVLNHAQYVGRLQRPLPQTFVPTVSITHIGRGEVRDQLWAFVQPSASLLALRNALDERLLKSRFPRPVERKTFAPHIKLGTFYPAVRGVGLADVASPVVFAIRAAHLYKSTLSHEGPTYTIEATVPF